jgi:hypothetical protein
MEHRARRKGERHGLAASWRLEEHFARGWRQQLDRMMGWESGRMEYWNNEMVGLEHMPESIGQKHVARHSASPSLGHYARLSLVVIGRG